MHPLAKQHPYSGLKGVGIALVFGSVGWLAAKDELLALMTLGLGLGLLAYAWAMAPFRPLTIAAMWPDSPAHAASDVPTEAGGPDGPQPLRRRTGSTPSHRRKPQHRHRPPGAPWSPRDHPRNPTQGPPPEHP